ncbi:MAG: PDZ domain-containing protein [Acidobacteriota bacterium]
MKQTLLCLLTLCLLTALPTVAQEEERKREAEERMREARELSESLNARGFESGNVFLFPYGGYLGVELTSLSPELRSHFGVGENQGVMLARVVEDSPAERAGLQVGDIVTAINGAPVERGRDLTRAVRELSAGDQVDLEYFRDGAFDVTTATLIERERQQVDLSSMMAGLEGLEALETIDIKGLANGIGVVTSMALGTAAEALQAAELEISEELEREMESAMEEAWRALDNEDVRERLKQLERIETEELEERLREMEERLEEMEERLREGGEP